MAALAYLLTFSTYGTHLPGSAKGWVDAQHRIPGSPVCAPDPRVEGYWKSRLNETPWVLDYDARRLTLQTIVTVCERRQWPIYAVHVRTNHIHAVISAEVTPERVLCDLKAHSTRAFRSRTDAPRRRYWANHGSTRYLWNQASVNAAIDYVLNGQGVAMARYPLCDDMEERFAEGALTLSGSDSDDLP